MTTYGYARVSTKDQRASLDTQVERLRELGCVHVYRDVASGARASRPGLDEARENLRDGDVLVVTKLDRLGRTTRDTLNTIESMSERGITLKALDLDTSTAAGKLVVNAMSSLAQFERERLIERTREGIEHARSKGRRLGRPPALSDDARSAIVAAIDSGMTVTQVAQLHNVSWLTARRAYEAATGVRPMDREHRPSGNVGSAEQDASTMRCQENFRKIFGCRSEPSGLR